jgi:hypothetical protein
MYLIHHQSSTSQIPGANDDYEYNSLLTFWLINHFFLIDHFLLLIMIADFRFNFFHFCLRDRYPAESDQTHRECDAQCVVTIWLL